MSKWETIRGLEVKGHSSKGYTSKRKTDNFMKTVKTLNREDLKKYGEELYQAKIDRENSLIAAKEANLLKSQTLLKETDSIIKNREEKKKKTKTKKESETSEN